MWSKLLKTTIICLFVSSAYGEEIKAEAADSFMDSIAINVHAHGKYATHHNFVKAKLAELKVRYIRDGLHKNAVTFAQNFYDELGVKTTFITGKRMGGNTEWKSPLNPELIDEELADLKALNINAIDSIEGPNEYDLFHDEREKDWPGKLRIYQGKLYEAVKNHPKLKDIKVIAPSLTSMDAYKKAGSMDDISNFACVHLYQSTRNPETKGWGAGGYGSIDWTLRENISAQSPSGKVVYSTENGYKTTKGGKVPEDIAAKYTLRMLSEFYRKGIKRSYIYELWSDEWGLIRDDFTEKPSFRAVKNLISLVDDKALKNEIQSLNLETSFSVSKMLFQKNDGKLLLFVWNPISLYNSYQDKVEKVKPKSLTVSFSDKSFDIKVFKPSQSSYPLNSFQNSNSVKLAMDGDLFVLELTAK